MKRTPLDVSLREAIRGSGLTLNALSAASGVHSGALSRFVRDKRDLKLSTAAKLADTLQLELGQVRFLQKPEHVTAELEDMVNAAQLQIRAIGGKSRSRGYLSAIEAAVRERGVRYDRLLFTSAEPGRAVHGITHELHEHLSELVDLASVRIRLAPKPYFTSMTVTDNEGLIFLAAEKQDFYGIRFPGFGYGLLFTQYFSLVFDAYDAPQFQVSDEASLRQCCEACSSSSF